MCIEDFEYLWAGWSVWERQSVDNEETMMFWRSFMGRIKEQTNKSLHKFSDPGPVNRSVERSSVGKTYLLYRP